MGTKILFTFCFLFGISSFAQQHLDQVAWGIKNDGAKRPIAIDHYTNGYIEGIPGEDIHLPTPISSGRKVIVGVLDTGIDYNHPQLKNALAGKGMNAINGSADASDTHGHGTHISGIIAARLDASGFQGVSQNALILPVKVVQTGPNAPIRPQDVEPGAGTALTENVAKGLEFAMQNGAEVINLSLAWPSTIRSKRVDQAMELAKQKNVIIISSAGNDGTTANVYPCIYEQVICVGAHGPDGTFSHFTNYGAMVDVLAPGTAILSSWPLNKTPVTYAGQTGYELRNGTSMAAPFVAGAAAELLSRGYSPAEVKNRLLLGSRPILAESEYSSRVLGTYTKNQSNDVKAIRFGNLDLTRALNLSPSPLILPTRKDIIEVPWDGISTRVIIPITWTNRWLQSGYTQIKMGSQVFNFSEIKQNQTVPTPVILELGDNPESFLHLTASIKTEGYEKESIDIPIQLVRIIKSTSLPEDATLQTLVGFNAREYSDIRSITLIDDLLRRDYLFIKNTSSGVELALVQDQKFANRYVAQGLNSEQLLMPYRLADHGYSVIFTQQEKGSPRPNFIIKRFDAKFNFISESKLGTDITTLPENFKWIPFKRNYTLLWISLGFTPKLDQPKFDFRSDDFDRTTRTYKDTNRPRLYYLDPESGLRTLVLKKQQNPLQILTDGRVLISDGTSYFQKYILLTLMDGKVVKEEPLNTESYRMFIGLEQGKEVLPLKGGKSNTLLVSGSSTSGNLRVSGLGEKFFDEILSRSSQLDSLVSVVGSYHDAEHQYYFVQTHFDLQFFTSGSNQTISTSINRYSYISSMAFSKSFFQTLVRDQNYLGLPAVYTPASVLNNNTSEVTYADIKNNRVIRPAKLRMRLQDNQCTGLGKLIDAEISDSARQVFICGNLLIQIPLTIRR